jgi:DsbC/DsbD-like thiol-disulfide interchange protein
MRRFSLTIAFLTVATGFLVGQTVKGRQIVNAELISDGVKQTRPFTIGIHFTIEPGWYLYWKNPGDAGLPIDVQWNLPKGWTVGPIRFPVPSKFIHDDIVAYGYKEDVVLVCTAMPTAESGPLSANLDWLVCRESCMRGKATVTLDLNQSNKSGQSIVLKDALLRMPQDGSQFHVTFAPATLRRSDRLWTCDVPLQGEGIASVTDFYPAESDGVFINYDSIHIDKGHLIFSFSRENEHVNNSTVKGLLIAGRKGYEYSFPMDFSSF